jgi:hypothetical protein
MNKIYSRIPHGACSDIEIYTHPFEGVCEIRMGEHHAFIDRVELQRIIEALGGLNGKDDHDRQD